MNRLLFAAVCLFVAASAVRAEWFDIYTEEERVKLVAEYEPCLYLYLPKDTQDGKQSRAFSLISSRRDAPERFKKLAEFYIKEGARVGENNETAVAVMGRKIQYIPLAITRENASKLPDEWVNHTIWAFTMSSTLDQQTAIAAKLGYFGPRAEKAIPVLQKWAENGERQTEVARKVIASIREK